MAIIASTVGAATSGAAQASMATKAALASSAISSSGGLFGGFINRRSNRKMQDKMIQANKDSAQLAHEKDIERWDLQNEYNTPKAMRERLEAAGINPHSMGGGSVSAASTLPAYSSPTQQSRQKVPIEIPDVLGKYQEIKNQQLQNNMLKSQIQGQNIGNVNDGLMTAILGTRGLSEDHDLFKKQNFFNHQFNALEQNRQLKKQALQRGVDKANEYETYGTQNAKNRAAILDKRANSTGDPLIDFFSKLMESTQWGRNIIDFGKSKIGIDR